MKEFEVEEGLLESAKFSGLHSPFKNVKEAYTFKIFQKLNEIEIKKGKVSKTILVELFSRNVVQTKCRGMC